MSSCEVSDRMSRREFLKLMLLVSGAAVLSACGPSDLSAEGKGSGLLPSSDRTGELDKNGSEAPNFSLEECRKGVIKMETDLSSEESGISWSNEIPNLDGKEIEIHDFTRLGAVSPDNIIVPTLPLMPNFANSLNAVAPYVSAKEADIWINLFHWTKHANQAGFDIRQLTPYSKFLSEVVRGSLDGQGVIIKVAGHSEYPDGYIFIRQAANGSSYVVKLKETGEPITAFEAALKHGKIDPKEAARYLQRQLQIGTRINPSEVPQRLKDMWGEGPPPVLRFWWWALSYQAKEVGKTISQYLSSLPNIPILVVPAILFDCNNLPAGVNPSCSQVIE